MFCGVLVEGSKGRMVTACRFDSCSSLAGERHLTYQRRGRKGINHTWGAREIPALSSSFFFLPLQRRRTLEVQHDNR